MLFNYRYVPSPIEKFQAWLDQLVKVVWCRNAGDYSIDLLHLDLKAVIEEIALDDRIGDWLDGPIKKIDAIFKNKLIAVQRAQLSVWYDNNNDIEALCGNDPHKMPATYAQVAAINVELGTQLKAFFQSLFTNVIHLKAVTRRTAEVDAHYDAFVTENNEGKCPYCGYGDIKSQLVSRREAFDHFLPKGTYPFNSVNFKNLAPMCNECNSSYKLQKDPLWHIDPLHKSTSNTRRKAFYSYATVAPGISIDLTFSSADIDKICPSDIVLTVAAPGRDEELESWKEVFGIEERYKAKCCGKNDGKYWLQQALDECKNAKNTPQEILQKIEQNAEASPWAEINFLKKPFLIACQNAGLLKHISN